MFNKQNILCLFSALLTAQSESFQDMSTSYMGKCGSTRRDFTTQQWNATIYLTKGYDADSVFMPGQPEVMQILAERSAGVCLSLPWQEVLSPLVEGGVRVVEGACEMIKKNDEEKHRFWTGEM